NDECENQHRRVNTDFLQTRDAVWQLRSNQTSAPEREQDSQRGAQRSQQGALGQQLTDNAPSGGAERHTHRHLLSARRSADEQQVGDIGAGNQQNQADGAQQNQQRLPYVTDKVFVQQRNTHTTVLIALRILLFQARGDQIQLCFRLLHGHVRLQSRDDIGSRVSAAHPEAFRRKTERHSDVGLLPELEI